MLDVNEVTIYVPEVKEFVYIAEGSGDNLTTEDLDQGYIDYVYIETYYYKDRELHEYDGGIMVMRETFDSKYDKVEDLIKDALDYMYENENLEYIIIDTPDNKKGLIGDKELELIKSCNKK